MTGGARANILQDYVERSQRPEMTPEQALVKLLDARGILYELRVSGLLPLAELNPSLAVLTLNCCRTWQPHPQTALKDSARVPSCQGWPRAYDRFEIPYPHECRAEINGQPRPFKRVMH